MNERTTVKGMWVVIGLIALGVAAGVAEVAVRHAQDLEEPATAPGATTQASGEKTR